MHVHAFIEKMERLALPELAEDFAAEKIGLVVEGRPVISRVCCALDVTPFVVKQAVAASADMLVVHHTPLFLRLEGRDPGAPRVLSGSHLDSQPTGGKFDGVYGVLAALEAVQAILESGRSSLRPIEVVAWMNEEGSRVAPGMMGSAAFTGAAPLAEMLPVRDAKGESVQQALAEMRAAFPSVPERPLQRPVAAYVEARIEQGPVLEREGFSVGVVTGIQGKLTFRVTVSGEEAHAGTARRQDRKDALLAATAMIQALSNAMFTICFRHRICL